MKLNKKINKKYQEGLTLIELLIAMVISLIILSGISRTIANMSMSSQIHKQEAEKQEAISYAVNRISYALKHSFSAPCGSMRGMLDQKKLLSSYDRSVTSTEAGDLLLSKVKSLMLKTGKVAKGTTEIILSSGANKVTIAKVKPETDYIYVLDVGGRATLAAGSSLAGNVTDEEVDVVGINLRKKSKDLYMITDCLSGDLFKGEVISDNKINIPLASFSSLYDDSNAILSPIRFYVYYIGYDGRGAVGLRRYDLLTKNNSSIVDGVSDMSILWGLSGSKRELKVRTYYTSEKASSLSGDDFIDRVVSAKITYTMNSLDSDKKISANSVPKTSSHYIALRNKTRRD